MDKEKSIDVLNSLIEINNDRIEGYDTASKETEDTDLKMLFAELSKTSQKSKAELLSELSKLGGNPIEGTKTTGKLYRAWMDIKSALTGKDRKAILNSCEFGEDVAVDTYRKALQDNMQDLSSEQNTMINAQYAAIKADHNKVRNLRDMAAIEHK
jgi:uncharacterized protein (TIGR02284 family)